MEKKIYYVEIIGVGLALLYAVSCLAFVQYVNIPEQKLGAIIYLVLFGSLCVGAVAVITLKEWGRKLLIATSIVMMLCLFIRFLPQVDLVPLSYLFLNIIVFLYFTQAKVKRQFHSGPYGSWQRSILLIDDDETIIRALRPMLLSHGYSVLTAVTGEDGLQIVNTQKPDLVLLDVILPGIKGRDVCRKIKENPDTRGIPVLMLTAKNSSEDIKAEQEAGASGHLTKPVEAKHLISTIQSTLKAKNSR